MPRWIIIVCVGLGVLGVTVLPSPAGVAVQLGTNVVAPPILVPVPGVPVTYAPSVAVNYFVYGGQYYAFAGNVWYVARAYNGPWVVPPPEVVPRPILAVPVGYYRLPPPAWRHWRHDAPPHWAPRWGRRWEGEQANDNGQGHGKS